MLPADLKLFMGDKQLLEYEYEPPMTDPNGKAHAVTDSPPPGPGELAGGIILVVETDDTQWTEWALSPTGWTRCRRGKQESA